VLFPLLRRHRCERIVDRSSFIGEIVHDVHPTSRRRRSGSGLQDGGGEFLALIPNVNLSLLDSLNITRIV
jgi:hypothetical protein